MAIVATRPPVSSEPRILLFLVLSSFILPPGYFYGGDGDGDGDGGGDGDGDGDGGGNGDGDGVTPRCNNYIPARSRRAVSRYLLLLHPSNSPARQLQKFLQAPPAFQTSSLSLYLAMKDF